MKVRTVLARVGAILSVTLATVVTVPVVTSTPANANPLLTRIGLAGYATISGGDEAGFYETRSSTALSGVMHLPWGEYYMDVTVASADCQGTWVNGYPSACLPASTNAPVSGVARAVKPLDPTKVRQPLPVSGNCPVRAWPPQSWLDCSVTVGNAQPAWIHLSLSADAGNVWFCLIQYLGGCAMRTDNVVPRPPYTGYYIQQS